MKIALCLHGLFDSTTDSSSNGYDGYAHIKKHVLDVVDTDVFIHSWEFEKADKSNLLSLEIGVFNPLTGVSNSEIAASSRSSHKSQGFGSAPTLGSRTEYIEIIGGERPRSNDPFEGINTTWSRLERGSPIGKMVATAIESFDFEQPQKSLETLVNIHEAILKLPASLWKERKLEEAKQLILDCAGIQMQFNAERPYGVLGEQLKITINAVHQSKLPIQLESVQVNSTLDLLDKSLETNTRFNKAFKITLANSISTPYWLLKKGSLGTFTIDNKEITPTAVSMDSPKHLDLISQLFMNNGEPIHSLKEKQFVRDTGSNKAVLAGNGRTISKSLGIPSRLIGCPFPFVNRPQNLQIELEPTDGTALSGRHIIYFECSRAK